MESHNAIHGQTPYFDCSIFHSYVSHCQRVPSDIKRGKDIWNYVVDIPATAS